MSMIQIDGQSLDLSPINTTMDEIGSRLVSDSPAVAVLEPGDMTQYRLMLVPMWDSDLVPFTVGIGDGSDYLAVSVEGSGCAVLGRDPHWSYVHDKLSTNVHSAQVIAAFLAEVWQWIDAYDALEKERIRVRIRTRTDPDGSRWISVHPIGSDALWMRAYLWDERPKPEPKKPK